MELKKAIRNRRARFPKTFNAKIPDPSLLDELFEAANWAPTHRRTEPWRYVVITGEAKERLKEEAISKYWQSVGEDGPDQFKEKRIISKIDLSPYVIAIVLHRDLKERVPEWEEIASVAMSVQNLWLTATELDIAGYWSSPKWAMELGDFLELKENERCLGLFYLGYSDVEIQEGFRENWRDKIRIINN